MTKRFTNVNEDILQYGEWYCSAKSEYCADVIATALNIVTEKNEQLKSRNKKLLEENHLLKEYVEKENKQLKEDLEYKERVIKQYQQSQEENLQYCEGDVE